MDKTFLVVLSFITFTTIFASDEWYCKKEDAGKFEICRKCKSLSEDCEYAPRRCKCENMKFVNDDYELAGGPEQCQTDDPFCYVSENSNCDDIEYSSQNELIENIWFNSEIYYSYDACEARNQDDNVGNEKLLRGIKIIGDNIKSLNDDNTIGENLEIWVEGSTYQSCRAECELRKPTCGAWSFDTFEEVCYLHTVESNCGQFGKRKRDSEWISGYSSNNKCWSTKAGTDCPCSVKDRLTVQRPGTQHGAGGKAPLHATSSGSLTVQSVKVAVNKCKCILKRTKRGRYRCRKPICKPNGCQDQRRCRKSRRKTG